MRVLKPVLFGLLWGATAAAVRAGAFVWDGGSLSTSNWTDATNWNPNTAPAPGTANTFTFGGSTRLTNSADGTTAWTVTSITFSSGAGAYNISSGTGGLKLSATGIINNSTSLQTISANIALQGNATLNAASGDLALTGPISGAFGLTKTGNGALTLAGTNTFTGTTTLSAGTLNIGSNSALGTGTFALNAGNVTASGGARAITNAISLGGNASITGSNDLTLGGTLTNTSGANRLLTISNTGTTTFGSINLANSGTNRTLTVAGTGNVVVTGTIANGSTSTASVLTKTSTGSLTLRGNNTFGGNLNLSAGTLNINNAGALGTGRLVIAAGTTIDNTSGAAITNSRANLQTWNGNFTFGGSNDLNLGTGAVTLAANATITTSANTLTVGGAIGGGFVLTKAGAGELTLSGANTFSNGLTLSAGTLNINSAAALGTGRLTIAAGTTIDNTSGASVTESNNNQQTWNGNFTFAGTNNLNLGTGTVTMAANTTITTAANTLTVGGSINGSYGITKAGSGTLALTGSNNYSGPTSITGGTLAISQATALGGSSNAAANLVIDNATLQYTGSSSSSTGRSLTIGANGATIENVGTGLLTFTNTGSMGYSGTGARTLTLQGTNTGNNEFDLTIADAASGSPTTVVKNGSGAWMFNSGTANTYTGDTIINAGTLLLSQKSGRDATGKGNIIIGDGTSAATLKYYDTANQLNNSANVYINNNGTFNLNGFGDTMGTIADGAYTSGGFGQVQLGAGSITVGASNASGTFSGVISGTGGVTSSGTGTWTLAGNNTFSGGLTLAAGGLNINNAGALGTGKFTVGNFAGAVTFDNTSGSALTVNGISSQQWNNNFTFGGSNDLNLGTSAVTLGGSIVVTTNGNATLTVGGAITDGSHSYNLTKAGTGTLTLAGANTQSGDTSLNGGTLNLNNASALGTGGLIIAGGTTINNTSGSGLTLTNSGAGAWNGNFTYGGSNDLNLGTAAIALGSNVTVTTDTMGSGTLTVGGAISGGYGVTKDGSGTMVLTGGNSYSGTTTVSNGTLQIGSGGTSGTLGSGTVVNNSSLVANRSDSFTLSNAMSGTGSLTQAGTGTTTLSAANSYSGGTTVQAGTLKLANTGAAGAAGNTITLAGGTLDLATDTSVNAYNVNVTGNATILSDRATAGAGINHALGTLAIGGQQLTVGSGSNVSSGTAGVSFGATSITGNAGFNVTNVATSSTVLTLGALNDNGSAHSLTKSGNGTLTLGTAAASMVDGTTFNATGGTTNLNATNALGTLANVTLSTGATVALGANQTIGALSGAGGTVALGSSNLTVGSTNNLSSSYGGSIQGSGTLTKAGSGTLTLSGTNSSLSGNINVTQGALVAAGATALGTGNVTVSSGAGLGFSGNVTATSGNITLNGTGVGNAGALYNVGGTNTVAGNIIVGSDALVAATAGTLTLSGSINLSPTATANTTLTFNPSAGATINASGYISDGQSPSYALSLAQVGAGTLTLSNSANDFYGNITVGTAGGSTNGTLQMTGANALPLVNINSLLKVYSGSFNLNNLNTEVYGSMALGGGASGTTAAVNTGTGTLTLDHDLTFDATNNANGATIAGKLQLANGTHFFYINDSSAAAYDTTISAIISGTAQIDKYGTGTLLLTGANTYTAATTVQQGILSVQNNTALGTAAGGTYVSSGATLQLSNAANGNITVADALSLSGSGVGGNGALQNVAGNNTWTGGITVATANARIQADSGSTLTITTNGINSGTSGSVQFGGAGNITVASSIGSGVTGVTKQDSGTLILGGGNSFSGPISIQGGTLSARNNAALGANNTATIQSGATLAFDNTGVSNLVTQSTTINVNGTGVGSAGAIRNTAGSNMVSATVNVASDATITADASTVLSIAGNVSGSSSNTLTVGTAAQNGNVTIGGTLNGVNLIKQGSMVTAGNTTTDGTLLLNGGGSIGTVDIKGGKVAVAASTTLNTGNFTAEASTSLLIASGGTVNVTGSAVFNSHTLDGSTGTLQVNGNNSLTFNGTISAANMTLVLNGASVGTNSGPLTVYLGGSNVTVGSIIITGDTILDFGNSAGTTLTSGALDIRNGAKVQVINWTTTANNALLSTIWYASSTVNNTTLGTSNQTPTTNSDLGQITFVNPQGSVGSTTTWVEDTSTGWFDHEIRPTPEPSTYGAILMSGCLGLLGFRRYRRRKNAVATKA